MRKNTSVALGDYFESFVENTISQGRYKNASEVIRAGLDFQKISLIDGLKAQVNLTWAFSPPDFHFAPKASPLD
jgi:putative addiction module antidote protein, CC2985 family